MQWHFCKKRMKFNGLININSIWNMYSLINTVIYSKHIPDHFAIPLCHDPTKFGVHSKGCHYYHCRSNCCCPSSWHVCIHIWPCTCHQYRCNMTSCRDCLHQCYVDELQQVWLSYVISDQMYPPLSALVEVNVIIPWCSHHYWSPCTDQKESTTPSCLFYRLWCQMRSKQ